MIFGVLHCKIKNYGKTMTVRRLNQLTQTYEQMVAGLQLRMPFLKQPGLLKPAKNGRVVLPLKNMVPLFTTQFDDPKEVINIALYIVQQRLQEFLKNEKFPSEDLPSILNQHYDLAEFLLLHHDKYHPTLYKSCIEGFEEDRGKHLQELANAEDATSSAKTEAAYWLLGQADKKKALQDYEAYAHLLDKAEGYLRQAHEAGYSEATDALATLLYIERAVGEWPYVEESMSLWGQAARSGNPTAIKNFYEVVQADDSLTPEERVSALQSIWQGATCSLAGQRDPAVKEITKALKKAGIPDTVSPK
jgi:hypothetical protein